MLLDPNIPAAVGRPAELLEPQPAAMHLSGDLCRAQVRLDVGPAKPAVPAEGANGGQAALLGPAGHGLGVDAEQLGDLTGREEPVLAHIGHTAHSTHSSGVGHTVSMATEPPGSET